MLQTIQIGNETGQSAGTKINLAIDKINILLARPQMSAAVIKTYYEQNADTNAFTDALKTKLEGIDLSVKVDKVPGKGLSDENLTRQEKDLFVTIPGKVDKRTGYDLSEENYTTTEKYTLSTALLSTDLHTPLSATNKVATLADIGSGGGPGGSTTLDALTDTDVTGVRNDQVLTYSTASSKWEAHDPQGGSGGTPIDAYTKTEADNLFGTKTEIADLKLTDLSDFTGTPTAGQVMVWNGTQWEPASVTGGTY